MTQEVLEIALSKMEALDSPRSLAVAILLRYEEFDQMVELPLDPSLFLDSESYLNAACATAFLKKAKFLPSKRDLESEARQKWREIEEENLRTNLRISRHKLDLVENEGLRRYVSHLRRKIRSWIGAGPRIDLLQGRFGPGATLSNRSSLATVPDKLSSRVSITDNALPFLTIWKDRWSRDVQSRDEEIQLVQGNHYFTVAKKATERRSCGKEPLLNVYFQLALGEQLRRRLFQVGINLETAQETHKRVACEASVCDGSATVDLSSASDCLVTEVVRLLIPRRWFEFLDAARSKYTKVDDEWVRLQKFSSMGNGFTFELETLIFLAIICALDPSLVPGKNVFVNGDDIIVPQKFATAVLGALRYFGFKPNVNKTFTSGVFRESCGGDYWNGRDVRPFYLKESLDEPSRLISLANGLRRNIQKLLDPVVTGRLLRVWFGILDRIPRNIRNSCRGPVQLGDLVIHDVQAKWEMKIVDSIRYVRVWKPLIRPSKEMVYLARFHPRTALSALLYGVQLSGNPDDDEARFIVPRDVKLSYAIGWVPFS